MPAILVTNYLLFKKNKSVALQSNFEKVSTSLRSKEIEESRLRSAIGSLETKCNRLREYIKKLTTKCEEWEQSYERQAKYIDKLQEKNVIIRERYRKLAGDVQRKSKVSPLCVFW